MTQTAVLISIKPKFSELIYSGKKTLELRRVCPKLVPGDLVLVYESGSRKALVGGFEVGGIISESATKFYGKFGGQTGVSEEEFDQYFLGASVAYGIRIARTWKFREATELKTLRRRFSGFQPPQSYRYLKGEEMVGLLPAGSLAN